MPEGAHKALLSRGRKKRQHSAKRHLRGAESGLGRSIPGLKNKRYVWRCHLINGDLLGEKEKAPGVHEISYVERRFTREKGRQTEWLECASGKRITIG